MLTSLIFRKITLVPLSEYKTFLPKAKDLLEGHEKDEDFVAVCLLKNSKLWTYEKLLFKIGVGISTKQLGERLSSTASVDEDAEKDLK